MDRLGIREVKNGEEGSRQLKRLFFAIEMSESVIATTERVLETLSNELPANHVRLVKPSNLHMTLKFLGEVDEHDIQPIIEAGRKVFSSFCPLRLAVADMGLFPNHDNPTVLWFGVKGETELLRNMEVSLSKELEKLGFPPSQRPFEAHLTIGRVRNDIIRGQLVRLIRKYKDYMLGDSQVEAVTLFESVLARGGAMHRIVERFPLTGE